jgi:tetratricopeptide (TPR) repeat protein
VLFYKGDLEGAKRHFHAAEELQREHLSSEGDYLHSVAGARYCSLLLARARTDDDRRIILKRATELLQWEKNHNPWKVAVALGHVSIGRALMAMQYQPKKHKKQAQGEIDVAVDIIKKAGAKDEHPRVLVTSAHFYRLSKNYDRARSDLEDVYEIADRCDMDLYRVDYSIENGHLLLDDALLKGKPIQQRVLDEVKTNLESALDLIGKQGYHLKDAELSILQARLAFYGNRPHDARNHIEDGEKCMNKIGYMAIKSELKNIRNEISQV